MSNEIFVSYSRRDNEQGQINRLMKRIQEDFISLTGRELVFFIDEKIRPREDWQDRILGELRESRLLLACMSPAYLESEHCEWEYSEYVKRELTSSYSAEGVLPIYLKEIPDWDAGDYDKHCPPWVSSLRRRQRYDLCTFDRLAEEPFGGADNNKPLRDLCELIKDSISDRECAERNIGNLVDHNPHFIGRQAEMRQLRDRFVKPGAFTTLTAIHGLPGIGKTAFAKAYAHKYAGKYGGGCWWVDCAGHKDLRSALATLQGYGELDFDFKEEEKADPDRKFERVLRELKNLTNTHEPHCCLLILDNVDQSDLLQLPMIRRLPAKRWLHVLVTTWLGPNDLVDLEKEAFAFLPMDKMEEEDALALIESYQQDRRFKNDAERAAALDVVRLLDRFTLAVERAAVFLSQPHRVGCHAFLKRLKTEGLRGLEDAAVEYSRRIDHGDKTLTATIRPLLELLEADERLALDYAALLPADCIAVEWLEFLVGDQFPEVEMAAEVGHLEPWELIIDHLRDLQLLNTTDEHFSSMHRLVQEVIRNQEDFRFGRLQPLLIRHALHRCEILEKNCGDPDSRWELNPLTAWAKQLMTDDPENGGELESTLGNLLRHMGRYRDARELLTHSLRVSEELLGPQDPRVATCMIDLGWVEWHLGNYYEAKLLCQRALIIDKDNGTNSVSVGRDLSLLGRVEQDLGNLSVAKNLFEKALAIDERAYDPNHPTLAIRYSDLGRVEQDLGNLSVAKNLFEKALAIDERAYDPNHPTLAILYSDLGRVEQDLGNLSVAKNLFEKALAIDERAYDPNHPTLAILYSDLGRVEQDLGNLSVAKNLFEKALAIDERAYDPNHPTLAIRYSDLGRVEQDLGNLSVAKNLFEKALAIDERAHDPNHPTLAILYSYLGRVEQDLGNLSVAKNLFEKALAIDERAHDPNHPTLANLYSYLGRVEQDLGNLSVAKNLFEKALAIDERAYDPNHPTLAILYSDLGRVEQDLGNLSVAKNLFEKALAIDERAHDPNHPTLAIRYSDLGRVEKDLGNLSVAKNLFEKALAIDERAYDPNHPTLAIRYSNLGRVEQDLGNLSVAKNLFEKALAIDERAYDPNHPTLAIDYSDLGRVEQDLGNLSVAKNLFEKALAIDEQVWPSTHHRLARIYFYNAGNEENLGNLMGSKHLLERAIAIWEQNVSPTYFMLVEGYLLLSKIEIALDNPSKADLFGRRAFSILNHFSTATGCEYPKKQKAIRDYTDILQSMGLDRARIHSRLETLTTVYDTNAV